MDFGKFIESEKLSQPVVVLFAILLGSVEYQRRLNWISYVDSEAVLDPITIRQNYSGDIIYRHNTGQ